MEAMIRLLQDRNRQYQQLEAGIWTMDNHKWALLAWAEAELEQPATLIHVDAHWDGVNDCSSPADKERLHRAREQGELETLISEEYGMVRWDSFIAPAIELGLVNRVHFHCFQTMGTEGIADAELLRQRGATQVLHPKLGQLVATAHEETGPLLFDFDADLFFRDGPYYNHFGLDERIDDVIQQCRPLINRAAVVTIAQSTGWNVSFDEDFQAPDGNRDIWDEDLAERVARRILEEVQLIRSE